MAFRSQSQRAWKDGLSAPSQDFGKSLRSPLENERLSLPTTPLLLLSAYDGARLMLPSGLKLSFLLL